MRLTCRLLGRVVCGACTLLFLPLFFLVLPFVLLGWALHLTGISTKTKHFRDTD